jgi:hypothetical protein
MDAATVTTPTLQLPTKEAQSEEDIPVQDYADGALRAWSTVIGAFLLQFYAVGVVCI